jgi:hypothetical protein
MSRSFAVTRSFGMASVLALVLVPAIGAAGASGAPHVKAVAAKAPSGTSGEFNAVSAVPRSTDVWAVGGPITVSNYFIARRHAGKWQKEKLPAIMRGGTVLSITAGSSKVVWASGQTADFVGWLGRWHGRSFETIKLPTGISNEAVSVSASSASNAWAVGDGAMHWNGKVWKVVPLPSTAPSLSSVGTSSATNAWGIDGLSLVHWNGKTWTVHGTAPVSVKLVSVATSGPKHAYAVGTADTTKRSNTYIMSFNGKTWSHVRSPNPGLGAQLTSVTMRGASAWAVGYASTASRQFSGFSTITLHSTGGKWTTQHVGLGSGYLFGVSAQSSKRVYAVGGRGADGVFVTSLAIFNGHKWTPEPARV